MNKEQIDEFYHLLRVVSNSAKPELTLTVQEGIDIFHGLSHHLLAGGDYPALVKFLQYYGEKFLIEPAFEHLSKTGWKYERVVEFGAGLGWLGRGIASRSGYLPTLFVDKRPWALIDVVADLETTAGMYQVLAEMKPTDLIVMSELLHCLDAPKGVMETFSEWPMLVLEYCPVNPEYRNSYNAQIKRYGAKPISAGAYPGIFSDRKVDAIDLEPYILMLIAS